MGIRFCCENGHNIHVKDHLAGKRGICPKCGVKVDIPEKTGDLTGVGGSAFGTAHEPDGSTTVSWFVRTAEGEEFGPASPEEFETWIREGRVTDDCLIWQEGWEQWRLAADVGVQSPSVTTGVPATTSGPPTTATAVVHAVPSTIPRIDTESQVVTIKARKRRSQRLVYALLAMCILLLVPLIYVVTVKM